MALAHQSARDGDMAEANSTVRALVDAIDEPALIVERGIVRLANAPARQLLGERIESRDVRLAIRHPQALEHIQSAHDGDIDVTGIGEPGRSWRLIVRRLDGQAALLRLIDR